MDVHTLKNLEKAIDKQFGDKEAHIYYSQDLTAVIPKIRDLEKKELPGFSIIFSHNMTNKFIISGTDLSYFKFNKDYEPNEIISLLKLSVTQNPKYFTNNHLSILINNPEQMKYLKSIKERFSVVKEYRDKEI